MITPTAPSRPLAAAADESPPDYGFLSRSHRPADRLSWLWLVRQAGQAHADLLTAPSLDWETAKRSHAQLASVRAVENGVSLLRPTGDGLSQAVDHQGRVLAAVDSFATDKAVLVTSVPTRGVATLYAVIGDSLAYLCLLGLVALGGMTLLRRQGPAMARSAAVPSPV